MGRHTRPQVATATKRAGAARATTRLVRDTRPEAVAAAQRLLMHRPSVQAAWARQGAYRSPTHTELFTSTNKRAQAVHVPSGALVGPGVPPAVLAEATPLHSVQEKSTPGRQQTPPKHAPLLQKVPLRQGAPGPSACS